MKFRAILQRAGCSLMIIVPSHLYKGKAKEINLKWKDVVEVEIEKGEEDV